MLSAGILVASLAAAFAAGYAFHVAIVERRWRIGRKWNSFNGRPYSDERSDAAYAAALGGEWGCTAGGESTGDWRTDGRFDDAIAAGAVKWFDAPADWRRGHPGF